MNLIIDCGCQDYSAYLKVTVKDYNNISETLYDDAHYNGGYPAEIETINDLTDLNVQYVENTDIDLKPRQTTIPDEVCSGMLYGGVIYFYYAKKLVIRTGVFV